jgi:hypothetical protein
MYGAAVSPGILRFTIGEALGAAAKESFRLAFFQAEGLTLRIEDLDPAIRRLFIGVKNTTGFEQQGLNFPAVKTVFRSRFQHEPP